MHEIFSDNDVQITMAPPSRRGFDITHKAGDSGRSSSILIMARYERSTLQTMSGIAALRVTTGPLAALLLSLPSVP